MAASSSRIIRPEQIEELLSLPRSEVESALDRICSSTLVSGLGALAPVVEYSLLGGGKRFRGVLVSAAYQAISRKGSAPASGLGAAVEMVHAYSLVHDDLPCMDVDDVRRGRPSTHRKFDVNLATIAGVVMVPLAARVAFRESRSLGLSAHAGCTIVRTLMHASGASGMIGGQLLDLEGEGKSLGLSALREIHAAKTGALMAASAAIGAMAAGASEAEVAALRKYGELTGLAFQIADDLLDVTASTEVLGKTAGRDAALGKSTYPALMGLEAARDLAEKTAGEAIAVVSSAGVSTPLLEGLAAYVISRRS